jgi:hypothetical protein
MKRSPDQVTGQTEQVTSLLLNALLSRSPCTEHATVTTLPWPSLEPFSGQFS